MLVFANSAASLITTRKGALSVMPSGDEIQANIAARRQAGMHFKIPYETRM